MATETLPTPATIGNTNPTKVYRNFIDGEWVESSTGETFEDRNPADTRDVVGIFQKSGKADVDAAVDAAKRAFALWYDALIHLWRAHGVGLPRQMIPAEFEPALEGGYIVAGSPATVRERLKRDNDIAGINYCICRLAFGDLTFEESKRSVELFAREVMPAL